MKITSKYPDHLCINHLFEAQVARNPEATALVFEGEALSYGELNVRANRLAHRLIALGVGPDQLVAICVERSPAMVIGLMAILKAGGAYVPLDPEYSGGRLAFILADTAPVLVLADAAGRQALGAALQAHTVLDPRDVYAEADANPEVTGLTPSNLAYIIYTSGSTGQPKGVMVEHAQVVRLFDTTHPSLGFEASDVWCLFHSFAFDFSVWELWGALRYGGTLVLVPHAITHSPQAFYQLICEQGVTVLNQTPSAFTALMAYVQPSSDRLRYVIFGGEALQPSTLREWYGVREESVPQLVNMYGITETTVHVTYYPLTSSDAQQADSVIGQCLPDLNLYLLDAHGQPVPMGDVGEMYVGGAGVARGYLNRPELTAGRFLHDPFAGKPEARMYKTGDLARYLPNSNLVFLGRNDDQVKIRGFRIELGEIAAKLAEHPFIREAVVVAKGEDIDKRLVAYVLAQSEVQDASVDSDSGLALAGRLRDYLSGRLPDYMVPSAFVRMESFPLTANGKLDREALPVPPEGAFAHKAYEAPLGEIEVILAGIWSELLGIEQIGRHDNFFALGGHSLMAVQLMQKVRSFGLECSLSDIFETPRLANLATQIARSPVFNPQIGAITVRAGGTEPPVFFVPSGLADYSYAISLAQQIRVSCPIHVLPWSAIGDPLPHSMEDMAERMIRLIQAIQPEGPYRITGYSSGGILAYAIAHALICKEACVEFLGFIDVPAPHKLLYKNQGIKHYFIEHVKAVASEAERHKFDVLNEGDEFAVLINKAQDLGGYDLNADISLETVKWQVIYHFSQIAGAYKPSPLPVNIYHFYAADRERTPLPLVDMVGGWRELLPDLAIRSVSIPGGHLSMMEDVSNRKHLAEAMNRALS
ncbi:amino acid adenylation domain-containing protein [Pseudomonas sp. AL03]|uniref:non-ribosomal peptide synthetase n=1 Tax=Pseudomonas sp. AL03 TaxID=3042230 RepID=UPI00249B7D78|nr:amino acid adenylation domain-containing protein [Pseudomonas sp. AL03]MDI3272250.1 amino acid adenylation domain-containing protein [Pseudomonas sp. AL03]